MRKELEEIAMIDNYLHHRMASRERITFESKMHGNSKLSQKVKNQQLSYSYIQAAGRAQLKEELEQIHQHLWSDQRYHHFRRRLKALLKK